VKTTDTNRSLKNAPIWNSKKTLQCADIHAERRPGADSADAMACFHDLRRLSFLPTKKKGVEDFNRS